MKFISIISAHNSSKVDPPRKSTLVMEANGALTALGNLPHGYTFRCDTPADAERLAAHVNPPAATSLERLDGLAIMDSICQVIADRYDLPLDVVRGKVRKAGTQELYEAHVARGIDAIAKEIGIKD